jgi:hypothetical protein
MHVYFPIDTIADSVEYGALKDVVKEVYTYFDKSAADTARFFFGNENAEVMYFDGTQTIAEYIKTVANITPHLLQEIDTTTTSSATPEPQPEPTTAYDIPQGKRNVTLSTFAFTMLKKYGDCEKARGEFVEQSKRCNPPLTASELKNIWDRAVHNYITKIANRGDYIPPHEYKKYAAWGELQPIDIITPPPFPFKCFPKTLAEFAGTLAEYTQTAPEMACVLLLGALGAVFQKKYSVVSVNRNIEQLSIYAVAINAPAERKSEVIRYIIKPFQQFQSAYNHENADEFSKDKAKLKALKAALIQAEGKQDGTDEKQEILIERQIEYDRFTPKTPLTVIADDTTSEALITLLVNNGERMFIASGEGGIFSNMKGRYRQGGDDIEIYLKGHSGDYVSVHRKSREPEEIKSPALSLAICVQPFIVYNVLLDEENTAKGLTGRIVYSYPTPRAGSREVVSEIKPTDKEYNKAIFYALQKTTAMTDTKKILLSDKADEFARKYFYTPEKRIEDRQENAQAWHGKAFGLSIRIAGLFHAFQCCENDTEPADSAIDVETMEKAATVTECLSIHAEKVFAGNDEKSTAALYLIGRIKKYGKAQVTKRKMWQSIRKKFGTVEYLDEILKFLQERSYIKVEKVSTGGRPSEVIRINPLLLNGK